MTNVFFIWSGARSEEISLALRDLLQNAVQGPKYYHSEDIPGGSLWRYALQETITASDFGVVCLTPENRTARWPHFETGLIAQAGGEEKVVPYLYDLEPADVEAPLGDLQPRRATRADTLRLAHQIGDLRPNHNPEAIEQIFQEFAWERFRGRLNDLPEPKDDLEEKGDESTEPRRLVSKIDEVLERVRRLDKSEAIQAAEAVGPTETMSHSNHPDPHASLAGWHWYLANEPEGIHRSEVPNGGVVVDENEEGALIATPVMWPKRDPLNLDEVLQKIDERGLSPIDLGQRLHELDPR